MNTNTIYKTLAERFPTYEALKSWFQTDEGGHIAVTEPKDSNLAIFYTTEGSKAVFASSAAHAEYFRSVVWDKVANRPVCASPCHGRAFTNAIDEGVDLSATPRGYRVETFVDGVMINLFWHAEANKWQIATRTQLGAHCRFYSNTTYFDELFWNAMTARGIYPERLDKSAQYSWVLQSKEERIVVSPKTTGDRPTVTLVEVSHLAADGTHTVEQAPTLADYPASHQPFLDDLSPMFKSLEDVKTFVSTMGARLGCQYQGVVIRELGEGPIRRWKLRTNEYDAARFLRGNEANLSYRWLDLWSKGKLGHYLRIFSEESEAANALVQRYKDCTAALHAHYVAIYRDRRYPLGAAPHKFRKLLWDLHAAGSGTYFPKVRDFLNGQDTARKLWLANYELRYGADHNPAPKTTRSAETTAAKTEA